MTTQLTFRSPSSEPSLERRHDPTVEQIIAAGRSAPAPSRGAWLLAGTTSLLLWASFTPLDYGSLAWISLVPLILLIRIPQPTRRMYRVLYVCGIVYSLVITQWMRYGDPSMYLAWLALGIYLGVYLPLFVAVCRVAVHRYRVPLVLAVPVVWVGLEYARAHLLTGCGWYFLGHTQHGWIELIQISDLVGAYGVSFVIALASAAMARLVPASFFARLNLVPNRAQGGEAGGDRGPSLEQVATISTALIVLASTLAYGEIRRRQAKFNEGPRVALIQGNFTTSLKHDPNESQAIFLKHHWLTGRAVPFQPDLIVWPETMYRSPLLESPPDMDVSELRSVAPKVPPEAWRDPTVKNVLADMSRQTGAAMIIGIDTLEADQSGYRQFNSAVFIRPDLGVTGRYDKIHRVPFGEYIPLKEQLPWLHKLTPFSEDDGIAAGRSAQVFQYGKWSLVPIICFEDTIPQLVRQIVSETANRNGKPVDCLVNLTNDGWFHGSSELDQHLITSVFRAVECRTPLVRAVNTGISAFIDGDGVVIEPEVFFDGDNQGRASMRDRKTHRWHKQLNAALISNVPLDNRTSLYVAWGDWFGGTCLFGTVFVMISCVVPRRSKNAPSA